VLGASPVLVERALPYVTVFSKSADIDVLIAPPEVIAALPGMTPEILNNFLKQRPSLPHDQKAIAAALDPVKATLPETRAFRVLTTLRFDNGRRTSSEAVILLGNAKGSDKANTSASDKGKDEDKRPYSILSWQDQVETVSRPLKQDFIGSKRLVR
jgi:general secretion pathway protein K